MVKEKLRVKKNSTHATEVYCCVIALPDMDA